MAYVDFQHCAVCDRKTFYDANINWDWQNVGQVLSLCRECAKKFEVQLKNKETGEVVTQDVPDWLKIVLAEKEKSTSPEQGN